jgi:hypothetical protein
LITIEDLEKADDLAAKTAIASVESTWKYESLKESSKDFLAELMTGIAKKSNGHKPSETELERLARASEDWKTFREGQFAAQHKALTEKVLAQNAQRHFDAVTSGLSWRREEFKRLGV